MGGAACDRGAAHSASGSRPWEQVSPRVAQRLARRARAPSGALTSRTEPGPGGSAGGLAGGEEGVRAGLHHTQHADTQAPVHTDAHAQTGRPNSSGTHARGRRQRVTLCTCKKPCAAHLVGVERLPLEKLPQPHERRGRLGVFQLVPMAVDQRQDLVPVPVSRISGVDEWRGGCGRRGALWSHEGDRAARASGALQTHRSPTNCRELGAPCALDGACQRGAPLGSRILGRRVLLPRCPRAHRHACGSRCALRSQGALGHRCTLGKRYQAVHGTRSELPTRMHCLRLRCADG